MSVGELPHGPRGREGVIAAIGYHANRPQAPNAKQSVRSTADAVLDDVIERVYDQLIMDALVLRIAHDLEWEDASSDLLMQHRSVRFYNGERPGLSMDIPIVEINSRNKIIPNHDDPGAKEREKGVEMEGKMEVEEVSRNGERCFNRSDHAVRPSVADFQSKLRSSPALVIPGKLKAQLISAW